MRWKPGPNFLKKADGITPIRKGAWSAIAEVIPELGFGISEKVKFLMRKCSAAVLQSEIPYLKSEMGIAPLLPFLKALIISRFDLAKLNILDAFSI